MTALVLSVLTNPMPLAIMGGVMAVLIAFLKGNSRGARLEREKQAKAEQKARDIRDDVQYDVGAMPADQVRPSFPEGQQIKRRLADIVTRVLLLIVILAGLTICTTAKGSFCELAPDLSYRQQVYDATNDAEAARHLAYLNRRGALRVDAMTASNIEFEIGKLIGVIAALTEPTRRL